MQSCFSIFTFPICAFGGIYNKSLPRPMLENFYSMFSSTSFRVSTLTFKSLVHFMLVFVNDVRQGSNFILLQVDIQFSQHDLLKVLSFTCWVFLTFLSKISSWCMHGFISGLSILIHQSVCLFMPLSYSFDNYSFVIQFETRKYDASNFILSQIALAIWVPYKYQDFFFLFLWKM